MGGRGEVETTTRFILMRDYISDYGRATLRQHAVCSETCARDLLMVRAFGSRGRAGYAFHVHAPIFMECDYYNL